MPVHVRLKVWRVRLVNGRYRNGWKSQQGIGKPDGGHAESGYFRIIAASFFHETLGFFDECAAGFQ